MAEKPQFTDVVSERLDALHKLWDELQTTTKAKTEQLSAARSSDLRLQTHADLNKWIGAMEDQLRSDDLGKDLTTVNRMLAKLKACEEAVVLGCSESVGGEGILGSQPETLKVSASSVSIMQKCLLIQKPSPTFLQWVGQASG